MATQLTGLRYYCSKQAVYDAGNKALSTVNEFQKKSQLCSMAINTIYNTAPISAYLLANYLSPDYSPATPPSWTAYGAYLAINLIKGYGAVYGTYKLTKDYLYKDEHETLDALISQIDSLSKQEHVQIGSEEEAPSNELTLHGCKQLINSLLYDKTQDLFKWHSITGAHREPFERCLVELTNNITRHDQFQSRLLDTTKTALNEVLSKLIELKATRSGVLTHSYTHPENHPRLKDLSQEIDTFKLELLNRSEHTFDASKERLTSLINTCLKTESIFTRITPTHELKPLSLADKQYLQTLRNDLQALPSINTALFTQKRDELNPILEACQRLVSGKATSAHEIAVRIQSLPQEESEDVSLLETLQKTLRACQIADMTLEEKKATLLQLLKTVDATYDLPFEDTFLDHVAENRPEVAPAPARRGRSGRKAPPAPIVESPRIWAENHLFIEDIDLYEAFLKTLKTLSEKDGFNKDDPSIKDYIDFINERHIL